MKATFENTVDILVKAYLNDTLQHANCNACAVGNLIAHAMDFKYEKVSVEDDSRKGCIYPDDFLVWGGGVRPEWFNSIMVFHKESDPQIISTGYTVDQIRQIESAFEFRGTPFHEKPEDPDGYKGLMAVVDVLAEIHGISLEAKESAKALFVKV